MGAGAHRRRELFRADCCCSVVRIADLQPLSGLGNHRATVCLGKIMRDGFFIFCEVHAMHHVQSGRYSPPLPCQVPSQFDTGRGRRAVRATEAGRVQCPPCDIDRGRRATSATEATSTTPERQSSGNRGLVQ